METTQNDGVSMRRVTAAEKETVLKLRGDVHSGMDFLESYFDYFLASPRMYPAAVFKDEKMVCITKNTPTKMIFTMFVRRQVELGHVSCRLYFDWM